MMFPSLRPISTPALLRLASPAFARLQQPAAPQLMGWMAATPCRHATKKTAGGSKNGRKPNAKTYGVKRKEGWHVRRGMIIMHQARPINPNPWRHRGYAGRGAKDARRSRVVANQDGIVEIIPHPQLAHKLSFCVVPTHLFPPAGFERPLQMAAKPLVNYTALGVPYPEPVHHPNGIPANPKRYGTNVGKNGMEHSWISKQYMAYKKQKEEEEKRKAAAAPKKRAAKAPVADA